MHRVSGARVQTEPDRDELAALAAIGAKLAEALDPNDRMLALDQAAEGGRPS